MEELHRRIEELEKELEQKNKYIEKLEGELGKKALFPALTVLLNKVQPIVSKPQMVSVESLKFFTRLIGSAIHIQFPETLSRSETLRHLEEKPKRNFKNSARNSEISKLFDRINPLIEQKNIMNREIEARIEKLNEEYENKKLIIRETYQAMENRIDSHLNDILEKLQIEFGKTILLEKDTEKAYQLREIIKEENNFYFKMTIYTDNNGITLLRPRDIETSLNDLAGVIALSEEDSKAFMDTLEENLVTIVYQIIEFDDEKSCCPIEISPQGLPLSDYSIIFNTDKISHVKGKDGAVKFNQILISEDCGFVYESVIEIFTSELTPHVINLLHVHVEDTSEEIPIEVIYILPDQTWSDYTTFENDAKGVPLRYKIIVKEGKVNTVLYNTGSGHKELPFIEKKIKIGDNFCIQDNNIAQVKLIPTGMLGRSWQARDTEISPIFTKNPPDTFCPGRHIEDLPGNIDMKIIYENGELITNGKEFAYPVCLCKALEAPQINSLDELKVQKETHKINNLLENLENLKKCVEEFKSGNISDKKDLLKRMTQFSVSSREGISEKPELLAEWGQVLQFSDRALRNLATDIRFGG